MSTPEEETLFYEQQERADALFKQLKEDLKLNKAQATKCLVDWVYINAEVDYLAAAAEKDDVVLGRVELSEFIAAAAAAWLKERRRVSPDEKADFSAEEILHALESFLMGIQDIRR